MSSLLSDSSPLSPLRTPLVPLAASLTGLVLATLATGPLVLWCGLALSSFAVIRSPRPRPRADALLRVTALFLTAAGLGLLMQGREAAVIPILAGVGALAGWLPFHWSISGVSGGESEIDDGRSLIRQLPGLMSVTTALIVAARLTPSGFALNSSVAGPVLFLAAALSTAVASARLLAWRRPGDALFALTAMAACGLAADVALRSGQTTLPVQIVRGDLAAIVVWIHGATVWLLLATSSSGDAGSGWRAALVPLLAADLAGLPPLPGFWFRGQLLLAMASRQTASSITGEFEPHAGMLTLAILFAVTWGALLATAFSRLAAPAEQPAG